ncbi:MAG: hypothetical protein CTY31_02870 [Hyphomicrobium sp.]|nr:MAG: hypothetical protein CTY31_02870 [Hyphomicrobium sp.]
MSAAFAATQGLVMSATAHAEDVVFKGSVTEIFGHHAIVATDQKKYLVNFGPRVSEQGIVKTGDTVSITGDLKKSGQVRAHELTLADGRVVEVAKDKKTWSEWFSGDDADDEKPFTASDAKKLATDKGYVLTSQPLAEKRHFIANGSKDGKTFDLALHRDGTIKEEVSITAVQAKKMMMDKGYDVIGDAAPVKKHFEALAIKNSEFFELHAHRDGTVEEARKVDKTDPRWGTQIQ